MSKNAIVVITSNLEFIKAQIDNLPNLTPDYNVVFESRCGLTEEDVKKVVGSKVNLLIDSQEILKEYEKIQSNDFIKEYSMGMNILSQWYFFRFKDYDKILFIDDDTILIEEVNNVFNEEHSAFYQSTIDAGELPIYANKRLDFRRYDNWDYLFQLNLRENKMKWKHSHINGSHRLYVKSDFNLEQYEQKLKEFFNNEYFYEVWKTRKTHKTGFLAARFEGFFAYSTNILNDNLKKYVCVEIGKPEKFDIANYQKIEKSNGIWHYSAYSHKLKWLEDLKKNNKIK